PLVAAGPRARFVGVIPLLAPGGNLIGTLTVLDPVARSLGRTERTALENLASLAVARVEALRQSAAAQAAAAEPAPADLPRAAAGPRARFVGVLPPLAPGGNLIGTLTVLDPVARSLGRTERTALENLASLAVARVEALRQSAAAQAAAAEPDPADLLRAEVAR